MSTHTCEKIVARLRRAARDLAELDLASIPDPALLMVLRQLRPVVCQLQAAEVRLVGDVDARGAAVGDGARSTGVWLRNELRMGDAAARLRCARTMARHPGLAAAFISGSLSLEHMSAAAAVSVTLSAEKLSRDLDQMLVDRALELAPAAFRRAAERLRDELCPRTPAEGPGRRGPRQHWLRTRRTLDGTIALTAQLEAAVGAEVCAAIDSFARAKDIADPGVLHRRRANALLLVCRSAMAQRSSRVDEGTDAATDGQSATLSASAQVSLVSRAARNSAGRRTTRVRDHRRRARRRAHR
jgi:hypothetical protein